MVNRLESFLQQKSKKDDANKRKQLETRTLVTNLQN